jgi:CheY-like chemotaxis protein
LATFRADPDRFDRLLTDELMPGMTGCKLAVAVHEIRPDLPMILMTGYSGQIESQRLQAAGVREVLKKPLLSAAVSACLARQPRPQHEALGDRCLEEANGAGRIAIVIAFSRS